MLRATLTTMAAARQRPAEGPLDELMLFHLVSATLNLLSWWLRHMVEVDIDTMAEVIERAVLAPVGGLRRQPPGSL